MEKAFEDLNDWLTTSDMPNGKKKVLQAAIKLFSVQGYDGTSTAQIAESSGMSQATIFKYFKSKDDLLLFIIDPIIEHILPAYGKSFTEQVKQNKADLAGIVHFIVTNRFQFLVQNKDAAIILISQVLINDKVRNMLIDKIMTVKGMFLDNVWQSLQDTGEMRTDIEPVDFIRLVVSQLLFYFLQSQRILDHANEQQIQMDLEQITKLVIRAIKK
ncbi:TetR/AcrR family transcriptional regulator [Companilactobacillus kimchiensis]|uniref:TetR family transcriptional regulator n=1 Tax=Companilactobacillus kimchiensis TaxID=993692 RepID=A0A0R2LMB5_9LACO|nr:TetR/AcrR family transcriptional regulator [Companilactobacillus kimchiensis]KRO00610.1 TetR family transcriptional regulator [Companilactobacillus kimchiensis]